MTGAARRQVARSRSDGNPFFGAAPSPRMARDDALDLAALESTLKALASAPRLEILHALREPRTLSEIRVRHPERRSISRQAVAQHLRPLVAEGLLMRLPGPDRRSGDRFVVDRGMLFAVVDELRSLARLRTTRVLEPKRTQLQLNAEAPDLGPLPRLVVVYGGDDGYAFPLRDQEASLGRGADNDIVVDHDPFVSTRHCVLRARRGRRTVEDLGSRNGTSVDFKRLAPGAAAELRPGAVLTIGRSHLVYQA